jgi:hypothetical protein
MDEQYGQLIQPKPVVFSFGAPGWYVLGAVILLLLAGAVWLLRQNYRKNRYRRQALGELKGYGAGPSALYPANMLLKRIAISRYGRVPAASIRGSEWVAFLNKSRGRELFGKGDAALLEQVYTTGAYAADGFLEKAKKWIKKHKYAF